MRIGLNKDHVKDMTLLVSKGEGYWVIINGKNKGLASDHEISNPSKCKYEQFRLIVPLELL